MEQTGTAQKLSLGGWFLATCLMVLFSVAMPVYVLAAVPSTAGVQSGELLAILLVAISGARLSWIIANGLPRLYAFAFWTFVYVFLAVPTHSQVRAGEFPGTTPGVNENFVLPGLILVFAGLAAEAAGAWVAKRQQELPSSESRGASVDERRTLILTCVGLISSAFYIYRVGPQNFLTNREQIGLARTAAFGDGTNASIITAGAAITLLVAIHAIVQLRGKYRLEGHRSRYRLLLILSLAVLLFEVNILTSSRYFFGTVMLSLLVLCGGFATVARARAVMLSFITLLLVAFPFFGSLFRRSGSPNESAIGVEAFIASGDYDGFAQIVNSVEILASGSMVFGQQALGVLFFWVPRDIWPDKPYDTGRVIAQFKGYTFENLSSPLWSESLFLAGWVGVLICFFALGFAISRGDRRLGMALFRGGTPAITGAILSFYLLILLRGSLLQAISTAACLALSVWFIRKRTTTDVHQPDAREDARVIAPSSST